MTATSLDLHVYKPSVDQALEWIDQIKRGEDVVMRYRCDDPRENTADPQGVLARVYLAVGHDAFVRHMKGLDRPGALCIPLIAQE